jgi:leucyl aminopeptidase
MAAIVVSLASALVASSSRSSSSLVFAKLRSSAALRVSFTVSPFNSRRGRLMAHTLAQATLGLTLPASIEAPKVSLSLSLSWSLESPIFIFPFYVIIVHFD